MSKSSAKKEYKKKIKQYKKYSKKYFEDSSPIVSDRDFDLLKKEILNLEKKFDSKDKDSPSKTLGFTPSKSFEKYPHRVKMLSLANAFDEEDLINFEKEIVSIYEKGLIKAPIHLSGNNEDILIKIFKKIDIKNDWVFSNWRNHYHALLKGINKQ